MYGRGPKLSPANPVALHRDAAGRPAVDLAKVRDSGHLNLAKAADEAGNALARRGLAGVRAQAVLVLDHSGSMYSDYRNGLVQQLVDRVLGFALQIDADGTVPVLAFDNGVHETVEVSVGNHLGVVDRDIWKPNAMGSTDLAGVLDAVRDMAAATTMPMFAAVITDGEPNSKPAATTVVCDLARFPVFVKFLALRPVSYLSDLDRLDESVRLLDNVNSKPERGSRLNLLSCSDLEFQEAMADEFDAWIHRAIGAGVLTGS